MMGPAGGFVDFGRPAPLLFTPPVSYLHWDRGNCLQKKSVEKNTRRSSRSLDVTGAPQMAGHRAVHRSKNAVDPVVGGDAGSYGVGHPQQRPAFCPNRLVHGRRPRPFMRAKIGSAATL